MLSLPDIVGEAPGRHFNLQALPRFDTYVNLINVSNIPEDKGRLIDMLGIVTPRICAVPREKFDG
jgi:hypothetical protein